MYDDAQKCSFSSFINKEMCVCARQKKKEKNCRTRNL